MPVFELTFAEPTTTEAHRRTLTGCAVPYGIASAPTSNGLRYRFHRPPRNVDDLIDVVREHDPDAVVGRLAQWQPSGGGLDAVARLFTTTAGNDALIEASEQVRTGFSIGADAADGDLTLAADGVYDVADWTATHLGLVRRPAFATATVQRIAAHEATAPPETPEHRDPDGDDPAVDPDVVDDPDDDPAERRRRRGDDDPNNPDGVEADDEDDDDQGVETMPAQERRPAERIAAHVPSDHRRRTGRGGPRTPAEAAHTIAAAARRLNIVPGETDIGRINAALADVVPGDGTNGLAGAFLRPEWLNELWTPENTRRPFIDAIGTTPLTSPTWQGWKWGTKPAVDKYAGNKAAIPTNAVTILPETGVAYRVAGGWDVDQILVDLGSPDFLEAMFSAATVDYRNKSETFLVADLIAGASVPVGAADSLVAALDLAAETLTANGANMSFVGMASDLWSTFLMLTEDEVPWWLRSQASINLSGRSTDVAGISVFVDPALPAGSLLAGDRQAVDFRDSGPIRLTALNIPNGGVDISLHGYQGSIIMDDRGLVLITVAVETAPPARSASSSK